MSVTMYKNVLSIGGILRKVVTVSLKSDDAETKNKSVNQMHHVMLLDRSGSMSNHISELMESAKKAVAAVHENDLITIIWFSSHNQCKTLVRGARKSDGINDLLDSIKSTLNQTCFSAPLAEALEVVNDLSALCSNFAVTLFTDGEPVTPWSTNEECIKIMEVLGSLAPKVIAVNTIGFREHYNMELLKNIAIASEYGVFTHSSEVRDYEVIFTHNYQKVVELAMGKIEAYASSDTEIMYLGHNFTKMTKGELKLSRISRRKNQVHFINDADVDFDFTVNGETYNSSQVKEHKLLAQTQRNFLYAVAYNKYYKGDRESALDILVKDLGDKYLADKQLNAFTNHEVGQYSVELARAAFKIKGRYKTGVADDNYLPAEDAVSVMDVLKVLAGNGNYYIPETGYKRIGKKVVDKFNLVTKVDTQAKSLFKDLIPNTEHMNVSVRYRMPAVVQLNPKQAAKVGLEDKLEVHMYRQQAVIKDGKLNMMTIQVLVDDNTKNTLDEMQVEYTALGDRDVNGYNHLRVHLAKLPVINRSYSKKGINEVIAVTKEIAELQAQQKVLNYFIKNSQFKPAYDLTEGEFRKFTPEQVELLKEHGVDRNLNYQGVKREKVDSEDGDFYETRTFEFQIRGLASLPKVEAVIEKMAANSKLTPVQALMARSIEQLDAQAKAQGLNLEMPNIIDFLKDELEVVKTALFRKRIDMTILKMGKVLTGSWWEGLVPDDSGNFTYNQDGDTLVVKANREIVYL